MYVLASILLGIAILWALAYFRVPLLVATLLFAAGLGGLTYYYYPAMPAALVAAWVVFLLAAAAFNLPPLRRLLFTNAIYNAFRRSMPSVSATEREALEAGNVWWEAEFFTGRPRWRRLLELPRPSLSAEERAFLDGPVERLCRMLDDWEIVHERRDLPPAVWDFLRAERFFGMIIPKRYGGLEFSAQAHSEVVMKIASRSITAAVTVMVPNSLGPAELLLHHGTEEQKDHYLPRLARGEEIPCFALTGPHAGSDASAIPDYGVVCRGSFGGRDDVLGVRLTWEKRYITLAPVATLLGLAFRLYDPDRLLGGEIDRGITLALVPTDTPGVHIGRRHNPLNTPFQNGPTWGRDVFIPLEWLIGGRDYIGQGWRMLVERLAVGRGISLPALSVASGKMACRGTGAYARVRKQFKLPIGRFEGVEEALARIAGYTYRMDAARQLTLVGLDAGEQPAVVSAIVKYQLTEHMRQVLNDAMDVHGGSGICLGPRNLIGTAYQAVPIGVTVEGANILTRSLIIYGQGVLRCHPYLYRETRAVEDPDTHAGRAAFDRALWGHFGLVVSNAARSLWLALTGARLVYTPFAGRARRYAQRLSRYSAAFALISDLALFSLGGALRRREKISGRMADALSLFYLASAALKRFEDQDRPTADEPLLAWTCEDALYRLEQALVGVLRNLPARGVAFLACALAFPFGARAKPPADALGHRAAALLLEPSAARDRLTAGIFVPDDPDSALGRIEAALPAVLAAEEVERKLDRLGEVQVSLTREGLIESAVAQNLLTAEEAELARRAQAARTAAIAVDDFAPENFAGSRAIADSRSPAIAGPTDDRPRAVK
ncbi:MAG TPA: acyl-CoA dehydrogenase [Burkholderiales bacterium]